MDKILFFISNASLSYSPRFPLFSKIPLFLLPQFSLIYFSSLSIPSQLPSLHSQYSPALPYYHYPYFTPSLPHISSASPSLFSHTFQSPYFFPFPLVTRPSFSLIFPNPFSFSLTSPTSIPLLSLTHPSRIIFSSFNKNFFFS